eukprot:EG_transcript_14160
MAAPACKFFNSRAGCRNGAACPFAHVSKALPQAAFPPPKRPRLEGPAKAAVDPDAAEPAALPPYAEANALQPADADARHPCLRVYGSCIHQECRFVEEPFTACLQCLKGKNHVVCDLGLEQAQTRREVEALFVNRGKPGKTCRNWLGGDCKFAEKCRFCHFLIAPGSGFEAAPPDPTATAPPAKGRIELPPAPDDGLHPCVRLFGHCRDGDLCPFRPLPRDACLRCLKGQPHDVHDSHLQFGRTNRLQKKHQFMQRVLLRQHQLPPYPAPLPLEAQSLDFEEEELRMREMELDLMQRRIELERKKRVFQDVMAGAGGGVPVLPPAPAVRSRGPPWPASGRAIPPLRRHPAVGVARGPMGLGYPTRPGRPF